MVSPQEKAEAVETVIENCINNENHVANTQNEKANHETTVKLPIVQTNSKEKNEGQHKNSTDALIMNGKAAKTTTNNHNEIKQTLKAEPHLENSLLVGMKRPSGLEDVKINFKKSKENHYFSKKNLIYDPYSAEFEELFGLNHSLYVNHNEFIGNFLKSGEDLSYIELLALEKPFKISSHFYLVNLGSHFFSKENLPNNNRIKQENSLAETESATLQFGNGFCSFRMYPSFLNPGILAYYYQLRIFVKEIGRTFYVVIPEDGVQHFHSNDLLLFHTSLNELMGMLFQKIQERQKGESEFRAFRFLENKKCLFPTILTDIIYEKILKSHNSAEPEFNAGMRLQETFEKYNKIGQLNNNIVCDSLEPLITQFFESELNRLDLPKMHLGDFFFGYNHPKIQALVKLLKRNKNFTLNRLNEVLRNSFCDLSPHLKLKQKLAFTDLQDNKIPLPYKCFRLYISLTVSSFVSIVF